MAVADLPLTPEELALTTGFAPRRLRTFAAGRTAARLALGSPDPIGILPGGAPAAPEGRRLSISHTDTVAIAAACGADAAAGLGVDVEDVARMDVKLRRLIVGPLDRVPEDADPMLLTATFSLRESVFKALRGQGAAGIYIRWTGAAVEAGVEGAARPLRYGWTCAAGHVLSYCILDG